jgi:ABC-type uncharacterized transport system substrate-binding protein
MLSLFVQPDNALADRSELVKGKKVLVVASYHKEYEWVVDIVRTLEHELAGADLTVFYMDSKRNLNGAAEKAREAFALYQELQPDAVVTIDDNAQSYFVVPYLRDKVKTPVVFCGVNDNATKYGFPAGNVTGTLEKKHYRESISFAQIINPKIRTVAVLYHPGPSNKVNIAQIEKEKGSYSADVIASVAVNSVAEVYQALVDYSTNVDAFLLLNMTGIVDEGNNQLEGHDVIALIADATDLVTIGASDWEVEAGALCGVIKSGEEQGVLASSQLLSLWEGKTIKEVPVTQNRNGQRYINLKTMQKLQIKLRPEMIIGTKIITEK